MTTRDHINMLQSAQQTVIAVQSKINVLKAPNLFNALAVVEEQLAYACRLLSLQEDTSNSSPVIPAMVDNPLHAGLDERRMSLHRESAIAPVGYQTRDKKSESSGRDE